MLTWTLEQEESWASDPNAFVADEDDEMSSYNVRSAAIDMAIVCSSSVAESSAADRSA